MDGNFVEIRNGRTADVFDIGRILVETWQFAFRGLLADDFLDAMSPADQAVRHLGRRRTPDVRHCVAVDRLTGEIVGFVNFGPARGGSGAKAAEIYALYVRPPYQGIGIGSRLVKAAACRVMASGQASLFAWVLSTNPNRGFYERLGARPVEIGPIRLGGVTYEQIAYAWHDVEMLLTDDAGAR
ncbi:GNAT family N-acetyltransferase [Rhizobium sp. TRM95111]|uniref:GNAT family N-acetyltransferase n=1 Tax=Rhizobium alarense TaxID=2846851 RepID=UPI001F3C3691|nr:GNAT family N-acetyltransferase [Rhizobium alarense]MCF3640782.1 GNAT family N-acetyltransferase [Rhizobium alarense]